MREIKYRIFYKPEQVIKEVHAIDIHNKFVYWFDEGNREKQYCHYSLDGKYGDSILMQYTGLKDKNGNEIYEGDILRTPAKNDYEKTNFYAHEIFYHDNDSCDRHVGFQMNRLHFYGAICGARNYETRLMPKVTNQMEIIGNIYENPDLLEDTQ